MATVSVYYYPPDREEIELEDEALDLFDEWQAAKAAGGGIARSDPRWWVARRAEFDAYARFCGSIAELVEYPDLIDEVREY